ncbi:LysR family transcriptional regulator [Mycolicibacterium sp.]|uniref:LysR family transcriptional regulator n=1 Tax=Mycolicibacterium sp. TaxID=2320850 RepID=UPI003D0A1F73
MTFELLSCFCAVAKTLSFNRAAADLSVSVSVVSGNVKRLEQELAVPLFHRTTRHVALTHEGAALLPYARDAIAARKAMKDAAVRLKTGSAGPLLIADWPVLQPLVEPVLHRFLRNFPEIEPRSVSMLPREMPDAVREGRIDIGLTVRPLVPRGGGTDSDGAVLSTPLFTVPLDKLLIPRGHRLAGRAAITVRDIADEQLLVPNPEFHPDVHADMVDFFVREGIAQRYQHWDVGSQFELVTLVAHGRGIALICDGLHFDERDPVQLLGVSGPVPELEVVVMSSTRPRPVVWNVTRYLESHAGSALRTPEPSPNAHSR